MPVSGEIKQDAGEGGPQGDGNRGGTPQDDGMPTSGGQSVQETPEIANRDGRAVIQNDLGLLKG